MQEGHAGKNNQLTKNMVWAGNVIKKLPQCDMCCGSPICSFEWSDRLCRVVSNSQVMILESTLQNKINIDARKTWNEKKPQKTEPIGVWTGAGSDSDSRKCAVMIGRCGTSGGGGRVY
jgi:hypothetical protein